MKTLLALSLSLAGLAGATTISEFCGSDTFSNNAGVSTTGTSAPGAGFNCAGQSFGAGNFLTGVQLFYQADYQFGVNPSTVVVWTFNTTTGTWSGGTTETVSGDFNSGTQSPVQAAGYLDAPFASSKTTPGQQILTAGLGLGTTSFAGVIGTASYNFTSGDADSTSGAVYAQITYSSAAPEPATLGLMGSALVGLGFLARRKK